jgi:predicted DNA-binding transcriptional regulator YafY
MRRADRLFQIVQHLRGGRLVTARKLSEILEVSERTIYRDIADLQSTGVPIDGEAGVGYLMREGYDLPPLMFNRDEIVALVAGARLVKAWGGATLARAAEEALVKISSVLPEAERDRIRTTEIHAPSYRMRDEDRLTFDVLEQAAENRNVIRFDYVDAQGTGTKRSIRPLGLWFWGGAGRRWAGASCATISACSGSTGSRRSRQREKSSGRNAARRSAISTDRWRNTAAFLEALRQAEAFAVSRYRQS